MQTATIDNADTQTITQLNSFLRGELSAVETYEQAIDKVEDKPEVRSVLESCLSSHKDRATVLAREVDALGGKPSTSSGTWGAIAKMVEGGAKIFGTKAAIQALEEGEDHGLKDYKKDVDKLSASVQSLVSNHLLPEQQRTHSAMSTLQNSEQLS